MDHSARPAGRRGRAVAAALLAVTVAWTMAACGDDDDGASTDTTATQEGGGGADATLTVTEFKYTDVEAPAGGTLEIVNTSGGAHTFTADDGSFDEPLGDGDTITVDVPDQPGEYPFHCEIHPSMKATLTVD